MSSAHDDTPIERLAELLGRGPGPAPGRTFGERVRRRLRGTLLRGLRPYSIHQAELDAATLEVLRRHDARLRWVSERHGEQIDRLEDAVRELILAAESLRRGVEQAARAQTSSAPGGPGLGGSSAGQEPGPADRLDRDGAAGG
jgi:hypothetical protein